MPARMIPAATLLTLIALVLAACEGDDPDPATTPAPTKEPADDVTGNADPADVEVIAGWADTLRKGDVEGAAEFFATPSTAENGLTYEIRSQGDARLFNESLPCGAKLTDAQSEGDFTTATFELTERPGPGTCGTGVGAEAQTAFVIEGGKIVEWRRIGISDSQEAQGEAV